MARTGLYKADVKKARDVLLSLGRYPSVDAIRIELGNTGSKSTIHKYLKELEEEGETPCVAASSISETLQHLVANLASQLQEEADKRVMEIQAKAAQQEQQYAAAMIKLQDLNATLSTTLQEAKASHEQELAQHAKTSESLQTELNARQLIELQLTSLKERLAENEAHRLSLEEKHLHAREALEHYRASVKEQRDQDIRRHEQQIQQLQAERRQLQQTLIVRQNEITSLNQDATRLSADLRHTQQDLNDDRHTIHMMEEQLHAASMEASQASVLGTQLASKDVLITELRATLTTFESDLIASSSALQSAQLELAANMAKLTVQQALMEDLRSFIGDHLRKTDITLPFTTPS